MFSHIVIEKHTLIQKKREKTKEKIDKARFPKLPEFTLKK